MTAIPFSLAYWKSIFPKPTAPFAMIFILLESFEIVSDDIGSVTELKIPSKFFEAAAFKKPILLGVDGESRETINQYSADIFYKPKNSKDFIRKTKK